MGTYLNPGKQKFTESVNSEIYVDKTGMISYLNSVVSTEQKYISVSRPRRFGKSMAVNMLCAYYGRGSDSRILFENKKLGRTEETDGCPYKKMPWDKYLGKFNVIRITMTDFIKKDHSIDESLSLLSQRILDELDEEYPHVRYDPSDLFFSMDKFYQKSKIQFVILIDEWDTIFRIRKEDKEGQTKYLDFLRDWLKDKDYIALAYMTGILPIKKYGEHSALNMFDEYSMIQPMEMAPYTGFTADEVQELCDEYNMAYEDISSWYDGYLIGNRIPVSKRSLYRKGDYTEHKLRIYSPLSVVKAMRSGEIENYWNQTETYEALKQYIDWNYDGLRETIAVLMENGREKIDISGYQNDMTTFHSKDDILTMLIHLGYLSYDNDTKEVFIPNQEVLQVFKSSTRSADWSVTMKALQNSQRLLEATWAGDEETVAALIEAAHDQTGNRTYNSEAALSYAIQLAYYNAGNYYTVIPELDSGKGYADLAYIPKYPDKPAMLVELKYDKDADTAVRQIKRQRYPDRLRLYKGNLILVSINYDKTVSNNNHLFKHHSCKIERG